MPGRRTTLQNVSQIMSLPCRPPPGVSHPSRRTSRRLHTVQPLNLPAPAVILQASHSLPCSLQLHWPPCAAKMFQALSKLGLTALAAPPAPHSHGYPLTSHCSKPHRMGEHFPAHPPLNMTPPALQPSPIPSLLIYAPRFSRAFIPPSGSLKTLIVTD